MNPDENCGFAFVTDEAVPTDQLTAGSADVYFGPTARVLSGVPQ
jgi:hypothetical protein